MVGIKNLLPYRILRETRNTIANVLCDMRQGFRNIIAMIEERSSDRKLGINTCIYFNLKDVSANKDRHPYLSLPYDFINKTLDLLNITPDDVFVDLGCGEGRFVFLASMRGAKKCIGVELSQELIDVARENLRMIKTPLGPVEFINADAATFDPADGTVFIMNNPFGDKTLAQVIGNIKRSLEAKPRKIRIAYCVPVFREVLDRETWLEPGPALNGDEMLSWTSRYPV